MRTFFHLFYIDEDHIFSKKSPIESPKNSRLIGSLAALWLLLTGDDLKHLLPEETKEERDRKATQKAGVILYLNRKIMELTDRRKVLEQDIAEVGDTDIEAKTNSILAEIEEVEKLIRDAYVENQELLQRIYTVSTKLEEAKFLKDRYRSLRSQYVSDIKTLRFILDAEKKGAENIKPTKCPFCEATMDNHLKEQESYREAAAAEMSRINLQMQDLEKTDGAVSRQITILETEMHNLNDRNNEITTLVNRQFNPRAAELKSIVESYKRVLIYQQEMYALDAMSVELNTDVSNKKNEEDSESPKFEPRNLYKESGIWKALSDSFNAMVQDCVYPGHPVSPD